MVDQATSQSDNIVPPHSGKIGALTVDGTSRAYDLTLIALGAAFNGGSNQDYVYMDLQVDGGTAVYFAFASVGTATINDAAVDAAGAAPLTFGATYCQVITGNGFKTVRIQRSVDKFLVVKCAGAGTSTLRYHASSQPSPSAVR